EFGGEVAGGGGLVGGRDVVTASRGWPGGDDTGGRIDSSTRREWADDAHHLAGPPLRARRERTRDCAAEERYQRAPVHGYRPKGLSSRTSIAGLDCQWHASQQKRHAHVAFGSGASEQTGNSFVQCPLYLQKRTLGQTSRFVCLVPE